MISREELLEWFTYEPETGVFRWRKRPAIGGGSAKVGDVAGSIYDLRARKRRQLILRGRRMATSRAAYTYVHGEIPQTALVDHKDGDTLNDRLDNLRLAGYAQNAWNRVGASNARYPLGVTRSERGRFKARIQLPNGKKLNLGTWDTKAEAHAARMGAAAVLHGEFWVGGRSESVDS